MCKLTKKSKRKSFTGYKSVVKVGKKFYSPVTGMEYKVGPVPKIRRIGKHVLPDYVNVLDPGAAAYNPKMVGKTGVFENPALPRELFRTNTLVKMTITGDLYEGYVETGGGMNLGDLIAGTHIAKIKEVKS